MADAEDPLKALRRAANENNKKREKACMNVQFDSAPPEAEVLRVWQNLKMPAVLQQGLDVAGYGSVEAITMITGDKID